MSRFITHVEDGMPFSMERAGTLAITCTILAWVCAMLWIRTGLVSGFTIFAAQLVVTLIDLVWLIQFGKRDLRAFSKRLDRELAEYEEHLDRKYLR